MRNHSTEIEVKLTLTPADIAALKIRPTFAELFSNPVRTENQTSVYFDTDRYELRDHGISLRVRRKNGHFIQTVKSELPLTGVLQRAEWEHPLQSAQPDLDAAANTNLEPLLTPQIRAALRPIFETRVQRSCYDLADFGWRIEIAVDQGEIVAGNRTLPICEIEFELKHGYRAALFEFARMIVEVVPAKLSLSPKSERGYQLIEDSNEQAVYADRINLIPGTTAAQAFQVIARSALHQFIANIPLLDPRNPEPMHQMRIALRRMRTAISLFRDIVSDGQIESVKNELKWINGELSAARDHDTMLAEVIAPLRQQHPDHRGLKSLSFTFARQRLRGYRRAEIALKSLRFSKMLVEIFAWIEIGEWVTNTDELSRAQREWPIEIFAAEQLSLRRKKIKKRGKDLEKLDPARRHRLRIQVKKARYATEFFANLYRHGKAARRSTKLLSSLKRLQSSLGELNDVAIRKNLCAELLTQQPRLSGNIDSRDRAFAAGLVTGNQEARHGELIEAATKAHAQFEEIKPFWK